MKTILITTLALISIGGCSSLQLGVREDSVIPTEDLAEAYQYANQCISITKEKVRESDQFGQELPQAVIDKVIDGCTDNMFILYAKAQYTVVEKGIYGEPTTICSEETIDGVNRCLYN